MDDPSDVIFLVNYYGLAEEDCNQQISDKHLKDISQSCCQQWRSLPSHLGLPDLMVKDIERTVADEEERRHTFFQKWKQRKGFDATYMRLIEALLRINCREDAEKVCKLLRLRGTIVRNTQPSSQNPPLGSHRSISIPSQGTLALPTYQRTTPNTGIAIATNCFRKWVIHGYFL